jgi:hypothetical protein
MEKTAINDRKGHVENEEYAGEGTGPGRNASHVKMVHGVVEEKIKSPSAYSGPILSEVERTVKESCMGTSMLKGQHMNKLLTWKKRGRGELKSSEAPCPFEMEGSGKKCAHHGGNLGMDNKGRKQNSNENKKIGSGLAETTVQSHRPQ